MTWRLKGLHVLMDVARLLPAVPFTVVGDTVDAERLLADLPPNVRVAGFLSEADLISLYQQAKVYVQLSAVESFGCALAEAMLCGCVPVVTNRGALPEVVGPIGKQVEFGAIDQATEAIESSLDSDESGSARKRIATTFPLHHRAERLTEEIRQLLAAA